ncbi:MAG: PilZ domain-containing protein [Candidatus Mariimomonas ferrooxydans]
MEKQRANRVFKKLEVKFETKGENTAITSNLSETGIFISTKRSVTPGSVLNIKLNRPKAQSLALKGKVIRKMDSMSGLTGEAKSGIGIQLISPPHDYIDYVHSLSN